MSTTQPENPRMPYGAHPDSGSVILGVDDFPEVAMLPKDLFAPHGVYSHFPRENWRRLELFLKDARCPKLLNTGEIRVTVRDHSGNPVEGAEAVVEIRTTATKYSHRISIYLRSTDGQFMDDFKYNSVNIFCNAVLPQNNCDALFVEDNHYDATLIATLGNHAALLTIIGGWQRQAGKVGCPLAYGVHFDIVDYYPGEEPQLIHGYMTDYFRQNEKWMAPRNRKVQAKVLVFCMVVHRRLGSGSAASVLSCDNLRTIGVGAIWGIMDNCDLHLLLDKKKFEKP